MATIIKNETRSRKWKRIFVHEFNEYLINFALLSFFLVSFAWYRHLVLASYHIEYLGYWAPLIEAAVLAKVIMIGEALHVGRRFRNWPLAVPTVYRTVLFSLLVVLFTFVESIVGALIHGKSVSDGITVLTDQGVDRILARCVLIISAFLPFFTVKEIERVFGPEKVRALFFRRGVNAANSIIEGKGEPAKPTP